MSTNKSKAILIRLSGEEIATLQRMSKESGFKNTSEFIRYKLFSCEDTKQILRRLETIEYKLD